MARDQIFISYSHKDKARLERLQTMLAPLQPQEILMIWADTNIRLGQLWKEEIERALARAKVAVLLVSPAFLASEWIHTEELPQPVETARREGLTSLRIPWRRLLWEGLHA